MLGRLATQLGAARDALDGDQVGAIGLALARAFAAAEDGLRRLDEGVANARLLGAVGVEYSWDPAGDKDAAREAVLERLEYARDDLTADLAAWSGIIANTVRPTSFRGQDVPGIGSTLRADDMPGFVREQTVKTILLLDALGEIGAMLAGARVGPLRAMAALRIEAANRLQFWVSDRDGFLFLAHALATLGHGDLLEQRGNDGKELTKTVEAVTRGVPQTVGDIIETVREAKARDLAGDTPGAITLLQLARERVDEIATYEQVKHAIPTGTHGLTLDHAWHVAQEARSGLFEHWADLERGGRSLSEGLWNLRLRQLEVAAQILSVVTGETAYESTLFPAIGPASKTSMLGAAAVGGAALTGAAGATWLLASAAATAEVGAGAYAAAVTWVVRNPQLSTALAELAGSIGLSVVDGGVESFLESLKTPEGIVQLALEVLLVKQAASGGAHAGAPDSPEAPRRAPDLAEGSAFATDVRDVLDRARALKATTIELSKQGTASGAPAGADAFDATYAAELDARRTARTARGGRPEPTSPDRVADARRWASDLANSAPAPDEAALTLEREKYEHRQGEIRAAYDAVMRGDAAPPRGTTRERLALAVDGDPLTGERVPLTFESREQFEQFQSELRAVFAAHGITDAVVQQLGSGTTGYRGNPNKEFGPWRPSADVDFAIFSDQALVQVQDGGVPVNTSITQGGKYTVFKNTVDGGTGFYKTPLGRDLEKLARTWNERIYGEPDAPNGFDFKMNLSSRPFARALSVMHPDPEHEASQ